MKRIITVNRSDVLKAPDSIQAAMERMAKFDTREEQLLGFDLVINEDVAASAPEPASPTQETPTGPASPSSTSIAVDCTAFIIRRNGKRLFTTGLLSYDASTRDWMIDALADAGMSSIHICTAKASGEYVVGPYRAATMADTWKPVFDRCRSKGLAIHLFIRSDDRNPGGLGPGDNWSSYLKAVARDLGPVSWVSPGLEMDEWCRDVGQARAIVNAIRAAFPGVPVGMHLADTSLTGHVALADRFLLQVNVPTTRAALVNAVQAARVRTGKPVVAHEFSQDGLSAAAADLGHYAIADGGAVGSASGCRRQDVEDLRAVSASTPAATSTQPVTLIKVEIAGHRKLRLTWSGVPAGWWTTLSNGKRAWGLVCLNGKGVEKVGENQVRELGNVYRSEYHQTIRVGDQVPVTISDLKGRNQTNAITITWPADWGNT